MKSVALVSLVASTAVVGVLIGSASARDTSSQAVVLRGTDSQNVRPFTLTRDFDITWSCPNCAGSNFVLATRQDIPVNSLGPVRGTSFLEKGRYTGVSVTASGSWTITMKPSTPRPVRATYVIRGADAQNVKPFRLTHDSDLIWSCPKCRGSNFIVSSDQDIPVNALGPTKGKSFLEKDSYTGVSVTASGPWVITLR